MLARRFGSFQRGEVDKTILGKGTGAQYQLPITLGQGPASISPPKDNLIDGALGKRSFKEKIVRRFNIRLFF